MDKESLRKLELLNQLSLTESQKQEVISFFKERDDELENINKINTDNVERMVYVMPLINVVREDEVIKNFSREDLQKGAPDTDYGYWVVPKVVEQER